MRLQMSQVMLALAEYRIREGNYPEQLSDLMPRFLPSVPEDLFAAKPLHYDTDGAAYRLYSIGRNGRDDGGVSTGINGTDDIVFGDPVQP